MSRKIVAGNWKMNLEAEEARNLFNELKSITFPSYVKVIIAPPSIYLAEFASAASNLLLAAQNVSERSNGAFTGEISASMLKKIGVQYSLVGHSERRMYFNETNTVLSAKVDQLLAHNIIPIFCCGESLSERELGQEKVVIEKQLKEGLFHLRNEEFQKVVIAYEPIWAIGTGITASSDEAQQMHEFIRLLVNENYGTTISSKISILYGGSCKPDNAKELFSKPDVDGGLIGGASLKADDFLSIINSF